MSTQSCNELHFVVMLGYWFLSQGVLFLGRPVSFWFSSNRNVFRTIECVN